MKLPSLHFNIASVGDLFKKKLSIILYVFLFLIVVLVGWVVYAEIKKISLVTEDNSGITGQIVRVNSGQHQEITKTLDENAQFAPKLIPGNSIFSTAPNVGQ